MAARKHSICDDTCFKCRYYCIKSRTCDYYLITKKRRCSPAGEGCDKYDPRRADDRKNFGAPPWYVPAVSEKIRICYEQGLSDYQIGRRLGILPYHIANWRHANMLPSQSELRSMIREEGERDWI